MAERLTDKNHEAINKCGEFSSCYSCKKEICYITEVCEKLGKLEDILEKYGVDIQNLDYILEDYSKNQGRDFAICEERDTLRQERDTWQKACELACEELQFYDYGNEKTEKGETMGVPQTRHRVFFVATRLDFDLDKIDMYFNYEPITYSMIKYGQLKQMGKNALFYKIAGQAIESDKNIADTRKRLGQKASAFQTLYIRDNDIVPTQRAKPDLIDIEHIAYVSKETIRNSQTFPQDYKFLPDTYSNIGYIRGMSVPPIMIKRLMTRLIESGLFDYKLKKENKDV